MKRRVDRRITYREPAEAESRRLRKLLKMALELRG